MNKSMEKDMERSIVSGNFKVSAIDILSSSLPYEQPASKVSKKLATSACSRH